MLFQNSIIKRWSVRFVVKIAMHRMWDKHAGSFPVEYLNNRRHINWNTHSVIIEHHIEFSHDFDWENIQILNKEKFLNKD